jgi:hypothetical protein
MARDVSFSEMYIADSSRIPDVMRGIERQRSLLEEMAGLEPGPESASDRKSVV